MILQIERGISNTEKYLIFEEHSTLLKGAGDVIDIGASWFETTHRSSLVATHNTLYLRASFNTEVQVH